MTAPAAHSGPDLHALFALFPPRADVPAFTYVASPDVPEPYRGLLVHQHHMTVTVEDFHGSLVDVRILESVQKEHYYARKILLALQSTGRIVQFGIVRVYYDYLSEPVRQEIMAGLTPLGRVLIQHDVLRRIEPTAFVRVEPPPEMLGYFGLTQPATMYGRLAYIHCDNQPAVELLEIVAPEPPGR